MKISKKTSYSFAVQLFVVALPLFYLTDGLYKIFARSGIELRLGPVIKGAFAVFVILYSLFNFNKSKLYIYISIVLLILCFLIGQFFLSFNIDKLNFFENFNTLFKYLSPLIYLLLVIDIFTLKKYPQKIEKYFKLILSINNIFIVMGLLTGMFLLKTYTGSHRFGYNGLIFAQNEASYIFILSITTFYYRRFYLGFKEIFFWIVLIPALIVGTKAVYLFLVLLLLFHLFKKIPIKKLITSLFVGSLLGYLVFHAMLNKILLNAWQVFMYLYHKKGLLFALTSGRNEFIEKKLEPLVFGKWLPPNFIFGGQDVVYYYTEMGFIDLVLFFGPVGAIFYSLIYFKLINLLSFRKDFKLFFSVSLFIIIFTSGHYFDSSIVGFYFIVFLLLNKKFPVVEAIKFKNNYLISKS